MNTEKKMLEGSVFYEWVFKANLFVCLMMTMVEYFFLDLFTVLVTNLLLWELFFFYSKSGEFHIMTREQNENVKRKKNVFICAQCIINCHFMQRTLDLSFIWSGIFHANIVYSENDICTSIAWILIGISIK